MTSANGHAPPAPPAPAPFAVPRAGPASAWPQRPDDPGHGRARADGDTVIRLLAAAVVLAVATFAAVVSYSHIFELGRGHDQDGTAARLLPLSVDGLIAAASLVMLHAARRRLDVPQLARWMLGLGVGATVAANVEYGMPFGWLSAVISAWPAVAFVGSVEMAVRFVRDGRTAATGPAAPGAADDGMMTSSRHDAGPPAAAPAPPSRRKAPSGSDRARGILRRDPGMDKAEVARRARVSVRQVQRVISDMKGTAS